MDHPQDLGLFTTLCGLAGGLFKALTTQHILMAVTIGSLASVMTYAAASAAVAYVVKCALDLVSDYLINRRAPDKRKRRPRE